MFADIFTDVVAKMMPWEGLKLTGPEEWGETLPAPHIRWMPLRGLHLPPQGLSTRDEDGPIYIRQWTILVEFYGADFDITHELVNAFLGAAHQVLSSNSFSPGQEAWDPGGATTTPGTVCQLQFNLKTPIPRRVFPRVPITGYEPTFKMGETEV